MRIWGLGEAEDGIPMQIKEVAARGWEEVAVAEEVLHSNDRWSRRTRLGATVEVNMAAEEGAMIKEAGDQEDCLRDQELVGKGCLLVLGHRGIEDDD